MIFRRRRIRCSDPEDRAKSMAEYMQRVAKDPTYTENMDFTKAQSAFDHLKGDYQKERQELEDAIAESEKARERLNAKITSTEEELEQARSALEAANLRAARAEKDCLAAQESKRTEVESLASQLAIAAGQEKAAREEAERLNILIANAAGVKKRRRFG